MSRTGPAREMAAEAASLRPPAAFGRRVFGSAPRWSIAVLAIATLVVGAPFLSLAATALTGERAILLRLISDVLPTALAETGLLLAGVALLSGAIGVGTAWLVTAHRFPGSTWLAWLLPLPLAVPTYITAYVYVELFDAAGPVQTALREAMGWRSRGEYWFPEIRSLPGCILVMSVVLYPYVYISARAMFLTQSAPMMEVARTLGAGRLELFRTVALPLARPALAVGLSLALLEALNDLGASEYLGVRTLTVSVYTTWLNRGSLAGAAQLACAMLAIIAVLLWLERRGRKDRRYAQTTRRNQIVAPVRLPHWAGGLSAIACVLPIALGFALPAAFLLDQTVFRGLARRLDAAFLSQALTTLWLAGTATLTILLLAVVMTTATRLARHGVTNAMAFLTSLGYAAPGTVLALGLLGPLALFDRGLNVAWRVATGERLGLVLMGSAGAILVAYTVRFLPIGTGSLMAGLERLSPNLDDAARTLGAKPRDVVLRIQAPLLRPALASAALLVFVDCLKELPATLLLRPLNTETLATVVYGHASRGSFEDGAVAALVIIAAGLVPVHLLTRRAEGGRRGLRMASGP